VKKTATGKSLGGRVPPGEACHLKESQRTETKWELVKEKLYFSFENSRF
jgi:hypothetical protein